MDKNSSIQSPLMFNYFKDGVQNHLSISKMLRKLTLEPSLKCIMMCQKIKKMQCVMSISSYFYLKENGDPFERLKKAEGSGTIV